MRYVTLLASCLLAAASLLFVAPAHGQSGNNFAITKSVIGGGGGPASSGNYTANGTIGQPAVGTSSGNAYAVQAGFWPSGTADGGTDPAAVTVSIPDGIVGTVGAEAAIPVEVTDLTGLDVTSFRLKIKYDPSLLEVTGISRAGTLSEEMHLVEVNTDGASEVIIGAADSTALSGAGVLLNLEVSYKAAGDFTLSFTEALLNEGDPAADTEDGEGTIVGILFGDVNFDSTVTAFDAALVLKHSVGLEQLQDSAQVAAEVSGEDPISPYDASLILQHAVDIIACFPVETGCQAAGKRAPLVAGRLAWGEARQAQDAVEVPLVLSGSEGVSSLLVEVAFDASAYAVEEVTTPLGREAVLAQRTEGDTLRLALAAAEAFDGEVATLRLRRVQAGAPAALEGTWRANEAPGQALAAAEVEAAPTEYALAPNYPNPFNPETTIRYALPEAAEVRLEVFDVLGREVAVLVDEEKAAGRHRVQFDAHELTSGAYFYRIEAGDFTQTREMVLVK